MCAHALLAHARRAMGSSLVVSRRLAPHRAVIVDVRETSENTACDVSLHLCPASLICAHALLAHAQRCHGAIAHCVPYLGAALGCFGRRARNVRKHASHTSPCPAHVGFSPVFVLIIKPLMLCRDSPQTCNFREKMAGRGKRSGNVKRTTPHPAQEQWETPPEPGKRLASAVESSESQLDHHVCP